MGNHGKTKKSTGKYRKMKSPNYNYGLVEGKNCRKTFKNLKETMICSAKYGA